MFKTLWNTSLWSISRESFYKRAYKHCLAWIFLSFCALGAVAEDNDFYPMTYNAYTNNVLNSFGVRASFITAIADNAKAQRIQDKWQYFAQRFEHSYEFIPTLKNMIAKEQIPQEFLFLAMAESEFNASAKSKAKAIGIWQIMPATARGLGLEISDYIDERKDPIKSTEAAIKYLKYLYESTGEWYLAAMAYNCGLGRLKRGIEEAGGDKSIETLLDDEAQYIPAETRNYIRTILAMSLLFNDVDFLKSQNMDYLLNRGATDSIASVSVKGGISLSSIAKSAKISLSELQKYNRHFTRSILPPGNKRYNVYLPYDKLRTFKQNFDESKQKQSVFITHIVQKGENLGSIARAYKTSVKELQAVNNIKGSRIVANQKLTIPIMKAKLADRR